MSTPLHPTLTTPSTTANSSLVRYVFLDIVGFSHGRSVEAQTDLVGYLNEIVKDAIGGTGLRVEELILLPTGDGLCIAIVQPLEPYDIHLTLALNILSGVAAHNASMPDEMRKFEVRIGLNQNVDNLVVDVNGERNVAGAGINTAQRLMGLADGGQIIVGDTVHETLIVRERYMDAFRTYYATVKHDVRLRVHQFIASGLAGLSTATPSHFAPKTTVPGLTDYEAYYLGYALKHAGDLAALPSTGGQRYAASVALHFLAMDAEDQKLSSPFDPPRRKVHGRGQGSFAEVVEYYHRQDFWVIAELEDMIEGILDSISDCFEGVISGSVLYVNDRGRRRLYSERPDVVSELGLPAEDTPPGNST